MSTWEERMAQRTLERRQKIENPAEFDRNAWRKDNCVFGANGEILYPAGMPCPTCGVEIEDEQSPYFVKKKDHPFVQGDEDEVCVCGWHESYHRGHDCSKDTYPPHACACSGGQPWSCCMNRHARQEQFLLQRLANVLRAAAEVSPSSSRRSP